MPQDRETFCLNLSARNLLVSVLASTIWYIRLLSKNCLEIAFDILVPNEGLERELVVQRNFYRQPFPSPQKNKTEEHDPCPFN